MHYIPGSLECVDSLLSVTFLTQNFHVSHLHPFLERYSKEGGEKGDPRCRRRSARFPSPAAERRGNRVDRWLAYI